jgi:predicted amidophosphoribosyltransferase
MLCPICEKEIKKMDCPECGSTVYVLGPYCYECGGKLREEEFDPEERILCSDDTCIGTINEKGFCNVCGKPFNS